jgi:hypothetical protein
VANVAPFEVSSVDDCERQTTLCSCGFRFHSCDRWSSRELSTTNGHGHGDGGLLGCKLSPTSSVSEAMAKKTRRARKSSMLVESISHIVQSPGRPSIRIPSGNQTSAQPLSVILVKSRTSILKPSSRSTTSRVFFRCCHRLRNSVNVRPIIKSCLDAQLTALSATLHHLCYPPLKLYR